jgi:hypothetical protein
MERVKKVSVEETEEPILRWTKIGGGSLWINGHIIKPGQTFNAKQSEIPTAFADQVVCADTIPPKPANPPVPGKKATYTLAPKGNSTTLYNVVNEAGKVLNEKGLTKEKAEALIQDLEA